MTHNNPINNAAVEEVIPDGGWGWGWVIVFSSFMIHFIMDGITYSMGEIYLHPIMEVLHSSRAQVSTIFGILPAITLLSGPIASVLVNTYGCRKTTVIGACLATLGFFASSFYANIWLYYLAIGIIGGIGFGLIYLPAIVSVQYYFKQKSSFPLGIAVCGSGLGTMIFPSIMPYIIHSPMWFDYNGALLTESAIIFICVIFGILMIPRPQDHSEKRRMEKKSRAAAKQQARKVVTRDDTTTIDIDEPRSQLLPHQESTPFQETKGSTVVVLNGQQPCTDHECRVSLLGAKENKSDENNDHDTIISKSLEHVSSKTAAETVAFDECHPKTITMSDRETAQSSVSNDKKEKIDSKQSFIHKLGKEINLKLLKNVPFRLFVISNFLTSLGFNVPYNFANDLAFDANVNEDRRRWIIMSIGISNIFGRVIIGMLGDRKWVNRLVLYNITLIIAGIATMVAPLCGSIVYSHMSYASLFGFFSGGYVGLTTVIANELVGEDNVSNALGIVYLFQGVATVLGTPIVGAMRDAFADFSQPYLWPYLIFGGSIVLSGIILFPHAFSRRRQEQHQK